MVRCTLTYINLVFLRETAWPRPQSKILVSFGGRQAPENVYTFFFFFTGRREFADDLLALLRKDLELANAIEM